MTNLESQIIEILDYEDVSKYLRAKMVKSLIKQILGEMIDEIEMKEFSEGIWSEDMHEWSDNYINELK